MSRSSHVMQTVHTDLHKMSSEVYTTQFPVIGSSRIPSERHRLGHGLLFGMALALIASAHLIQNR
jgi:hypothetical protein